MPKSSPPITSTYPKVKVTPSMRKATSAFMRRIAEEKIKAFGLTDTPEEYIAKAKRKSADAGR